MGLFHNKMENVSMKLRPEFVGDLTGYVRKRAHSKAVHQTRDGFSEHSCAFGWLYVRLTVSRSPR